jgi:hypothetical protein
MRTLLALALLTALTGGVAACTPAGADRQVTRLTGRHELTPVEAKAEFTREARGLTLPDGVRWPGVPVQTVAPDGAPVRFQPGYGTQAADGYWLCAWEGVAAGAIAPARRREVAATMAAVRHTYLYSTSLNAPGRAYVDRIVTAAGHPQGRELLANDIADNCPVIERGAGAGA